MPTMRLTLLALSAALLAAGPLLADPMTTSDTDTDPWLWLEDVEGERALDWVRARNADAAAALEADPHFADLEKDLLAILDSDARIPFV